MIVCLVHHTSQSCSGKTSLDILQHRLSHHNEKTMFSIPSLQTESKQNCNTTLHLCKDIALWIFPQMCNFTFITLVKTILPKAREIHCGHPNLVYHTSGSCKGMRFCFLFASFFCNVCAFHVCLWHPFSTARSPLAIPKVKSEQSNARPLANSASKANN